MVESCGRALADVFEQLFGAGEEGLGGFGPRVLLLAGRLCSRARRHNTRGMCGSDSQCSPVWPPIQNGKRIGKSASVLVKIPDVLGRLTKILGTFLLGPS